ncbi:hypothetical protein B0H17DRAFT_1144765 [Mycena rosella]|uniref:Reverse transcriptase zinc-binding domain-containing protein n=1 Tax=Mycena rosella TaxID=1033263 RepID=A0AAD7CSG1_MYCRO|nr:hypothetical protein B0H17DRAFT_1144765 [Mycena rosella]
MSCLNQIHTWWIPKSDDVAQNAKGPEDQEENKEHFRPPVAIESLSQGMCSYQRREQPGYRKCIPTRSKQSQYTAELYTTLDAIRRVNINTELIIISAQEYLQEAMNKKLPHWERKGWVGVPHRDVLRCVATELKAPKAPTFFKSALPDTMARMKCKQAATAAKRATKVLSTEEWDVKVPEGWGIPECENHAMCRNCEVFEDIEHILVKCTVLGCGLAEFHDDAGKVDRGAQRLYRILMSESAYMIWLLHNDWVINRDGELATEDEIINKWKFTINQRLKMDKLMANRPCKEKHLCWHPNWS